MTIEKMRRRRKWPRRLLIAAAAAIAVYVAFGFLGVPLIVRHVVVPRIGSRLHGTVALSRSAFNPFTFAIRLDELAVADASGRAVLGFDRFEGDFGLLATVFRSGYHFESAMLVGPSLRGEIDADGALNLASLVAPASEGEAREPGPRKPGAAMPRLVVRELTVTDGRLEFSDQSLIEPFDLAVEGVQFAVDELDTRPDHDNPHRLTASTASGAQISWEGVVRVDPLTSRGTIRISDLPLPQGTPYVYTLTEGRIASGRLAAELEYEFAPAAEPRVARVLVANARLDGVAVTRDDEAMLDVGELVIDDAMIDASSREITVAAISTADTRTRIRREPSGEFAVRSLLRADSRRTAGNRPAAPERPSPAGAGAAGPISLAVDATRRLLEDARQPWTLRVEQIAARDYAADVTDLSQDPPLELTLATEQIRASRLAMSTGDRTVAIDDVTVVAPDVNASMPLLPTGTAAGDAAGTEMAPAPAPGDTAPAEAARYVLSVESLRIEDGTVAIRDDSVEPPAALDLDALRIEATGISTGGGAVPFSLASSLQGSGQIEVSGDLDAFRAAPAASITVRMTGVPLKPLDPLAGPYLGHGIDSGRMAVVFPVTLEENHLEGDLQFTFDGLKLGKKVDSPHAPDAPIKLGLDLMRDGNDRIEGTLPIAGDVTDPGFSMTGLVMDAFVGLLGNIATAPFKLLGSIFGGTDGTDISHVEFEPGSAVLSAEALSSLDVLARALLERPALTLDATGRYDPERDEPVIREVLLEERILAAIHERTTLIETINEEAYRSWVTRFYEVQFGPATDDTGAALTVEQMADALIAASEVPDRRKSALARERAEAVIDVLVSDNGVPAERVTHSVADAADVLADSPRVDFAVK